MRFNHTQAIFPFVLHTNTDERQVARMPVVTMYIMKSTCSWLHACYFPCGVKMPPKRAENAHVILLARRHALWNKNNNKHGRKPEREIAKPHTHTHIILDTEYDACAVRFGCIPKCNFHIDIEFTWFDKVEYRIHLAVVYLWICCHIRAPHNLVDLLLMALNRPSSSRHCRPLIFL